MRRLLAAAVLLSVASSCATTPPAPAKPTEAPVPRAGRANYTLPVPSGWVEVAHERIASMVGPTGFALAKPEILAVPDYFRASIVVTAIQDAEQLPTDEATCAETATELSAAVNASVESARMVSLPATPKSCQISVVGADNENRRARASVVSASGSHFVVTCNYDARDTEAAAACAQVLDGFRFEAPAAPAPSAAQAGQ